MSADTSPYLTIERSPHGDKLWKLSTCTACDGTGTTWYPGCDAQPAPCHKCDGMGETAKFKRLDKNGEPFGYWRTSD
mgnify:CR=1 FL=1